MIKKIEKEFKGQIEGLEKKKASLFKKLKRAFQDINEIRKEFD